LPLEVFTQRNFIVDFIRLKLNFIQETKNRLLSHPLGDLAVKLKSRWSTSYSSYWTSFATSYGWDVISGNLLKSAFFETQISDGMGSPTNHCWCHKTRVTNLLCGIKISAVHCLILSQSTLVIDIQTDGQMDRRTDRQNYHS